MGMVTFFFNFEVILRTAVDLAVLAKIGKVMLPWSKVRHATVVPPTQAYSRRAIAPKKKKRSGEQVRFKVHPLSRRHGNRSVFTQTEPPGSTAASPLLSVVWELGIPGAYGQKG